MDPLKLNKIKIYANNSWFPPADSTERNPLQLPLPDIIVPETLQPPSIDILWTTNLSMDQLAEVLRENEKKWDDPSLIDLLDN